MVYQYQDIPTGYVRQIQATAVNALEGIFGSEYRNPNFQNLHCSVEYPVDVQDYPSIWLQYDDALLTLAGIAYTELDDNQLLSRWRFEGYIEATVVALSSLERDALYDELISQIAFSSQTIQPSAFRTIIEADPLIATNWSWDNVEARGKAASPGTPWGSEEIIYERTLALQVLGEFVTNPVTTDLVSLREITVAATPENVPDPESLIITVAGNWAGDEAAGTLPAGFPGLGYAGSGA
jgi:hypothetical protein